MELCLGERVLIGHATGTAVTLNALPPPSTPSEHVSLNFFFYPHGRITTLHSYMDAYSKSLSCLKCLQGCSSADCRLLSQRCFPLGISGQICRCRLYSSYSKPLLPDLNCLCTCALMTATLCVRHYACQRWESFVQLILNDSCLEESPDLTFPLTESLCTIYSVHMSIYVNLYSVHMLSVLPLAHFSTSYSQKSAKVCYNFNHCLLPCAIELFCERGSRLDPNNI